jgi:hypothetical protein
MVTAEIFPTVNLDAEEAVLGAMLWSRNAVNRARLDLSVSSFYRPWYGELFATICELEDAGQRCDAQMLVSHLAGRKQLGVDGGRTTTIARISAQCITAVNIGYLCREVRSAARVRALQAEHIRLGQALEEASESGDTDTLLDVAAQQSIAVGLLADEPETDAPVEGLSTWDDFVANRAGADRWIVRDLIGRHDMILILAAPGAGKSFLSRTVVTALSSGVHPFTLDRITPVRTLLVDLENAPGQVADESLPLLGQVKRLGQGTEDRGWVWMRPEGLNLRRREDAALFERVIAETRPDVVAFGSLYNTYQRGNDGWDTAAEEVQAVLKRLRSRYDLAFWAEGHMVRAQGGGHTGTPFGGTSWERWPTHGRVLKRATDKAPIFLLEAGTFRGDRGPRPGIPIALTRGGRLPFTAIYEEGELEQLIDAAEDNKR